MADGDRRPAPTTTQTTERHEIRRTISPFDLTAADNPGAVISKPLLKGRNYDEWACAFKTALCSRKKFGFLDGSIPKPTSDSPDYEDWGPINALLVSWIKMSIDPTLLSNISHRDNAKDLWDHIKKRFAVTSGPRNQQIKTELANCKQHGISVEEYFGRLTKIWDTMASYRPLRICKCGKCECDLVTLQEKDREEDQVQQFLYGLDERLFQTVRSTLITRIPLPTLEEAYNAVKQEEDQHQNTRIREEKPEVTAFAIQTKPRFKTDTSTMICKHCNRQGHLSETCFAVIGYPEWWGERPKTRVTQGRGRGRGASSGISSSTRLPVFANAVSSTRNSSVETVNRVVTDRDRDAVHGLDDEQWRTVLNLLTASRAAAPETLTGTYTTPAWILDSGASHHMTGNLSSLSNLRDMNPVLVILADGRQRIAVKEGTVYLGSHLVMRSVFYVEEMKSDLIAVGQLMDENRCVMQLADNFIVIQDRTTRMVTGVGKREHGTFYFRGLESAAAVRTSGDGSYDLWHNRMGHPSAKVVSLLPGVVVSEVSNKACDTCFRAKQSRDLFHLSDNKTTKVFELIHCDVWGPYRTPSFSGARYFLTIVDDYSRSVWIYLMVEKKETQIHLMNFVAMVERQFQTMVKTIRSDNGTEFMCLTHKFREQGIHHETSCVGTPNQNGRVERKHRHILNIARALRFQANLPIEFWGECILTSGYLINRTPSSVLGGQTPYQRLYNSVPSYVNIRVFGSLCYAHNQFQKGDKFASKSRRCVFIGYPHGKKGWRLFDLEKREFFVSRDVVFHEKEFPYSEVSGNVGEQAQPHSSSWATPNVSEFLDNIGPSNIRRPNCATLLQPQINEIHEPDNPPHVESSPSTSQAENTEPSSSNSSSSPPEPETEHHSDSDQSSDPSPSPSPPVPDNPPPPPQDDDEELGKGKRKKIRSVIPKSYVTNTVSTKLITSAYPIANYTNCARFSATHRAYQVAVISATEPTSFEQAIKDERWNKAMSDEIKAQELNKTWSITTLPPGKKAIGSKWVYKIKYNADGTLERYKARLVALGNRQVEGVDYGETFAPVVKMDTIRLFLKVAAGRNYEVHQMDVHNAFLHGDLEEEVYMKLPKGFHSSGKDQVCLLHKSLYGLKQAPRCWFAKLSKALLAYGFEESLSDYSLFTLNVAGSELRVLVYVDDLVIAGNSSLMIAQFKAYLSQCFHMKDLGVLKYFLGIEVARSKSGFYLCQRKYALGIIAEAGLLGSKPVLFPITQNHRLSLSTTPFLTNPEQYRRLVGRLIYLKVTRPELSYAVHTLAQFMKEPREEHLEAALRVVRYLKQNPGQGILLTSDNDFQLNGWCDSDYASCPISRRSVTGYFVQLGKSPIAWKTIKQQTVSRSSAEAEYRAMADLTSELKWLKRILKDLGVDHVAPMRMFSDSKSAIYIATNPVFHERTKHIEVDCHVVRNEIVSGNIVPSYVSTNIQLADILTKALGCKEFEFFINKLGITDLHAPT
ncbi:Retrovirus-related Pol polyprotein from transposon TNT 1-94 [Cardamine amara subsp. amara]|uniref:Retrovirus-related Pol polyprotein from transposon TNT 1-94 n=1 Tax=Cardamine amara subsp. amara TaxID=228776 RepID=A0ABD1AIM7_CARAN